jgi:hypothetical protein
VREHAPRYMGILPCLIALVLLGAALPAGARPKTDVIVLMNGDRYHGEIKLLDKGQLSLSTDAASTIQIEWDWVVSATSEYFYEVELDTGAKYYGVLKPVSQKRMVRVVGLSGATLLTHDEVVRLTPIQRNFWQRFNGSLTLSLGYTQANNLIQWNGSGNVSYRTRKWYLNLAGSTFLSSQDSTDATVRNSIGLAATRYLPDKKALNASLNFDENPDQGYSLRIVLSAGASVFLVQENNQTFSIGTGLAANRETPVDSSAVSTSLEWELDFDLERFSYQHPKRSLSAILTPYVSLQDKGRYRIDFNVVGNWELINDFYWTLTLQESYDSKPPAAGAAKNDLSLTTGISYSF